MEGWRKRERQTQTEFDLPQRAARYSQIPRCRMYHAREVESNDFISAFLKPFAKGYILFCCVQEVTSEREGSEEREIGDCRYDLSAIFLKLIAKSALFRGDCCSVRQPRGKQNGVEAVLFVFRVYLLRFMRRETQRNALAPFALRKNSVRMKNSTLSSNNKKKKKLHTEIHTFSSQQQKFSNKFRIVFFREKLHQSKSNIQQIKFLIEQCAQIKARDYY